MQVDAERFFLLVAAISAGCTGADSGAAQVGSKLDDASGLAPPSGDTSRQRPETNTPPASSPAADPAAICDRRWEGPSPCDEAILQPADLCWDFARALSPEDGLRAATCLERETQVHGLCGGLTSETAILLCFPRAVGTEADLAACRPLAAQCSSELVTACAGFSAAIRPEVRPRFAEALRARVAMPLSTLANDRECRETLASSTRSALSPK